MFVLYQIRTRGTKGGLKKHIKARITHSPSIHFSCLSLCSEQGKCDFTLFSTIISIYFNKAFVTEMTPACVFTDLYALFPTENVSLSRCSIRSHCSTIGSRSPSYRNTRGDLHLWKSELIHIVNEPFLLFLLASFLLVLTLWECILASPSCYRQICLIYPVLNFCFTSNYLQW